MTITTLILLLATGIVAVTAVDDCPSQNTPITDCCELNSDFFTFGSNAAEKLPSGIYLLKKFCGKCINAEAYCDTINGDGRGGWLVFQRRQGGSVDFNRTWLEYEDGFGKLTGEFWYGLRALHCLTGHGGWEMRVDFKLPNGTIIFLQYEQFKVASAKDKYKLTVGGFQGTTTDPMADNNGMYFTTTDRDNDQWDKNCAIDGAHSTGGWWHNKCGRIYLNVLYGHYVIHLNRHWYHLRFTEMKIRPHNCNI